MKKQTGQTTEITLAELLDGTGIMIPEAGHDLLISGIVADSRQAGPGKLFVAVKGETVDGHDYLAAAVKLGCAGVVVERKPAEELGVPVLLVSDGRRAVAELAASFHGHPERELKIVGITGTNGKTTTSYLLESMIRAGGGEPGVLGTVSYRYRGREEDASFTTPEPLVLYGLLREMVDNGVDHLIMEVSSHALVQERLHGIKFDVAAFTNLSHEHLDFHGDMDGYFQAKRRLFLDYLKKEGVAVIMLADEEGCWGERLVTELLAAGFQRYGDHLPAKGGDPGNLLLTCGRTRGDLHVAEAEITLEGIRAEIVGLGDEVVFSSPLVGDFNLLNMATALGIGHVLGLSEKQLGDGLAGTASVPGRLERVRPAAGREFAVGKCRVFVDFAHTPDALAGVLRSVRALCKGRLVVVFGCGGDRDRGKRPVMGEIAGSLAEVVIITTDNSRSENPRHIMADIEKGLVAGEQVVLPRLKAAAMLTGGLPGYDVIESRSEAIRVAIAHASGDDVVLICGKGHETYQLVGDKKYFFDDRLEARKYLTEEMKEAAVNDGQ